MAFDYGLWVASQRKKKKEENKKSKVKKKISKKPRKTPEIAYNPLEGVKLDKKFINWKNDSTVKVGVNLAKELEDKSFKLLQMVTGSGKTAACVYALGEIQKKNPKASFIILASKAIVQGLGWQKTILEYNEAFPNNKIIPYTIDTYDRFANITQNANSFKTLMSDNKGKNLYIVMDEVHSYKNPTSKRHKQMQKLPFAKKIGLSATPLTNDILMDSSAYLIFAGYFRNKTDFVNSTGLKDKIGMFGKFLIYDKGGKIDPHKWEYYDIFKKQMANVIYKPNVKISNLDLPDVYENYIWIDANDSLDSDLKSLVRAYNKRAFDSVTDYLFEVYKRVYTDESRLDEMLKIIDNKDVMQPLIFYQNVDVGLALRQKLEEKGFKVGEVSGQSDITSIDFNKDYPILVQYQSGASGIEFKKSNTSIFYQNQPSYTNLVQARGRNKRRGMLHDVNHYYLVAENYFDQNLYERVSNMEELNNEMIVEILEEYERG